MRMMRKIWILVLVAIIFFGAAPIIQASDIGMPVYRRDIGKNTTIETYYEKYKRDIEQNTVGKQEENRFIARLTYHASDRAALYGELGATDSDHSDGSVPIIGLGLKIELHNTKAIQLGAFASAQYIHDIEYKADLSDGKYHQTENYFEISTGILISRFIHLDEHTGWIPYGGFMVSKLDGDEDYEFTSWDGTEKEKKIGDLKDDGLFSIFAGAGLIMNDHFGIRLEGRFVNQSSFTAGFTYSF